MYPSFSPGEIVTIVTPGGPIAEGYERYIGTDAEVTSALLPYPYAVGGYVHWLKMHDGSVAFATPDCLRKKRPPKQSREDLGEWDLCPWRPSVQITINGFVGPEILGAPHR